jgi:hypothetical protein
MTVNNVATRTGTLDISGGSADMDEVAGIEEGDAFTVKSSVANVLNTATIGVTTTLAAFLAMLTGNGVVATVNASNFLVLTVTDGGNLIIADSTGTPIADAGTLIGAAGTIVSTVANSSAAVEIMKVIDADNKVVEVRLVNQLFRAQA